MHWDLVKTSLHSVRKDNIFLSHSFLPPCGIGICCRWKYVTQSLNSFSRRLLVHFAPPPKLPWYGKGERNLDIHHTRMRLGCSKLKAHLHFNLHVHVIDSPLCTCGPIIEDPSHYFLKCPLYQQQRIVLFNKINIIRPPDIALILHGDRNLTVDENLNIVLSVQTFINTTRRFLTNDWCTFIVMLEIFYSILM